MGEESNDLASSTQIPRPVAGDPFFARMQEINQQIAQRAYELFQKCGCVNGHDTQHWRQAESEILRNMPLDIIETENGFTIRAEVPGFAEKDLEIEVEPRSMCITGKRTEETRQQEGKMVYTERRSNQIFRVLELPARIDPYQVKATLHDGLLEVNVAKAEMTKKVPVMTKAASA
jgi:HSP20 family molecular chaperone IbpA